MRIRTTSTEAERRRNERVGRVLRPISQGHPLWAPTYGLRESVEARNAHWKASLPGRRQRSVGLPSQQFNASGYQLGQNLKAVLAWHLRTRGDITRVWRNGIPPGVLPEALPLAA